MDDGLANDLVAMWQSELAAMAADRELREGWVALLALWAGAATAAFSARPYEFSPRSTSPRSAGAAEPAGPPPAAPASHAGMDEIERLGRRVHELEQRLAELDQPNHRPQPRPRKRPKSPSRNGNA